MTTEAMFILLNGILIGILLTNIRIDLERIWNKRKAEKEVEASMLEAIQWLKKQLENGGDIK